MEMDLEAEEEKKVRLRGYREEGGASPSPTGKNDRDKILLREGVAVVGGVAAGGVVF
jgi:hypothetical protein